jgi:outer membrane receptor protein involved in Fe transport
MLHRVSLTLLFSWLGCVSAFGFEGRVIDARTELPIANAEVTIPGLSGSARTDAGGRFVWRPDPTPPFEILVLLPGGQVTKPMLVERSDWAAVLTVRVSTALQEEEVTVTGIAPSIETTPGSATMMLRGGEIAQRFPTNLMQALENVPGVNQVSEGQAAVPAVRGLANGRTLILIDGGRVTAERRAGPSATFLDPSSLEAVDVARGPGSVAYGSDVFGGVISVRTRRPEPGSPLRLRFTGSVAAGAPEQRGTVEVSKGFAAGGILFQTHVRNAEDYRGPDGADVFNSGWSDRGFLVRVDNEVGAGVLSAGLQSDFGQEIERPRNNSRVVRFYNPHENSHRFTTSYTMSQVAGMSKVLFSGFFGTYDQRTDQDRFATAAVGRSIERADVSSKDIGMRGAAERVVGPAKLEFGVDVNGRFGLEALDIGLAYDLGGAEIVNRTNVSIEGAERLDTGAFLQAEVTPMRRMLLAGGVRVDRVTSENRGGYFGNRSTSNAAGSGFGSVTVEARGGLSFTGQISRGFRDPVLSDRYYRGPTGRGFITGNPDLEPETSLQFDGAVRHTTRRVRTAVYFYQYRIDDLIERYQTQTDFFFFRNRGRASLRGFEVELRGDLGNGFSAEFSSGFGRGIALDDDLNLDSIGADTVGIMIRKQFLDRGYANVRTGMFADDDRPGPTEIRTPGYTLVDVSGGWRLHRALELRGLVRNILDTKYFVSPDLRAVFAPGISASVAAVIQY